MFGLGKKKDPLDELSFPNDGLDAQNPPVNNSIPENDPYSNSFGNDPVSQSMQNPDMGSLDSGSNDFSNNSFHPSEFNNSQPDSVVPTSPLNVTEPAKLNTASSGNDSGISSHQMELVSSKLDVLKAMMENLSQRISSLESKIDLEKDRQRKSW